MAARRITETMKPTALRPHDVVQLIAEPLAPFMVGAAQVVIDAELAGNGPGEIEQVERFVEYEGSDQRIGCACADVKRAGRVTSLAHSCASHAAVMTCSAT